MPKSTFCRTKRAIIGQRVLHLVVWCRLKRIFILSERTLFPPKRVLRRHGRADGWPEKPMSWPDVLSFGLTMEYKTLERTAARFRDIGFCACAMVQIAWTARRPALLCVSVGGGGVGRGQSFEYVVKSEDMTRNMIIAMLYSMPMTRNMARHMRIMVHNVPVSR